MKKRADARRDRGKSQGLTEEKEKGLAGNSDSLSKLYKTELKQEQETITKTQQSKYSARIKKNI
jgi:hypothetical protein